MIPDSMRQMLEHISAKLPTVPRLREVFAATVANTYTTTLEQQPDGTIFVITGDIPAMWLRDSAAQVRPYLHLAKADPVFSSLIAGVVRRQMRFILLDPYANAFNAEPNGRCHNDDATEMSDWVWERKYELDSLCAPLKLANDLWRATGQTDHFDETFWQAAQLIVDVLTREQNHSLSPYRFERLEGPQSDTLTHQGRGNPVGFTGMSWSGFRPSDDACQYNYLVPSNMFAVVALKCLAELPGVSDRLAGQAHALGQSIRSGIEQHARVVHPEFGRIYAYETDGLGNHNLMDDANVPSLLAMPYMGYCDRADPTYQATRKFVLSSANPYFYAGSAAKGIGSPHTPQDYIWPISLCMQGLTSTSREEKLALLEVLLRTDAGTGLMHEGFHKNDPTLFTRPWFAWANSLFAEFVIDICSD